jgi:hypothetical protein
MNEKWWKIVITISVIIHASRAGSGEVARPCALASSSDSSTSAANAPVAFDTSSGCSW